MSDPREDCPALKSKDAVDFVARWTFNQDTKLCDKIMYLEKCPWNVPNLFESKASCVLWCLGLACPAESDYDELGGSTSS